MADGENENTNELMAYLRGGIHHVGSFIGAGWPFQTGSALNPGEYDTVNFRSVTKRFTVRNTDARYVTSGSTSGSAPLAVFFGPVPQQSPPEQVQRNHHYVLMEPGDEHEFEVKCKDVYIMNLSDYQSGSTPETGSYTLTAELSNIQKESMPALTGSGIDE